jgi:hypothetical protein
MLSFNVRLKCPSWGISKTLTLNDGIDFVPGPSYRAIISIPKLNMSAAGVTLPSMTKSGEV